MRFGDDTSLEKRRKKGEQTAVSALSRCRRLENFNLRSLSPFSPPVPRHKTPFSRHGSVNDLSTTFELSNLRPPRVALEQTSLSTFNDDGLSSERASGRSQSYNAQRSRCTYRKLRRHDARLEPCEFDATPPPLSVTLETSISLATLCPCCQVDQLTEFGKANRRKTRAILTKS